MEKIEADPEKPCDFDISYIKPSVKTTKIFNKFRITAFPTTMVFRHPERCAEEVIMGTADIYAFASAFKKACKEGIMGRLGNLKYILVPVIIKEWMEEAR